jgi:ATP-dependent Lon protease
LLCHQKLISRDSSDFARWLHDLVIKPLRSLTEPLQVAKDNGAKRALIPIENKRNFLDVSADIMEHVDPVFYGDPKTAALKVIGAN